MAIVITNTNKLLFEHVTRLGLSMGKSFWGYVFSYSDIEQITGVPKTVHILETNEMISNPKFFTMINSTNKQLTKQHMRLGNIENFGYKVLHPNEYAYAAMEQIKKGHSRIADARYILDCTDTTSLSPSELIYYNDVLKKVNDIESCIIRNYKP